MLRSRRGTLEWNLETIGKLALYLIMFFFVVWATVQIIGLFKGGEHEMRAKTNLEYLTKTIDGTIAGDLQGPESSVIVQIPPEYGLIAFDKTSKKLQFSDKDKLVVGWPPERILVDRPNSCESDTSCLCVGKLFVEVRSDKKDYLAFTPVSCSSFKTNFIYGTRAEYEMQHPGFNDITLGVPVGKGSYNQKPLYYFTYTTYENFHPVNFHIIQQDGGIVLDG